MRAPAEGGELHNGVGGGGVKTCRHGGSPGSFDESARRLSHEELAVARLLAQEGHHVRSQAEHRGMRTGDLLACGTEVEVKSFQRRAPGARQPSPASVANKLLDARGQGAVAVVWAQGSGLSAAQARAGYTLFSEVVARQGAGKLKAARVVGDGFDVSFRVQPSVRAPANSRPPKPGTKMSP